MTRLSWSMIRQVFRKSTSKSRPKFTRSCIALYLEYFSGSTNRPREKIFEFDNVFGEKETQERVFTACVKQQVDAVMNGYNATVFAYGATGRRIFQSLNTERRNDY